MVDYGSVDHLQGAHGSSGIQVKRLKLQLTQKTENLCPAD